MCLKHHSQYVFCIFSFWPCCSLCDLLWLHFGILFLPFCFLSTPIFQYFRFQNACRNQHQISMRFLSSFCPSWPPLGLPLALPRPPTWLQNGSHIAFESQFNAHSLQEHPGPSPRSPKSLPKHSPNLDFGYDFTFVLMACWQCLDYFLQHAYNIPTTFPQHSCCIRLYLFGLSTLLAAFAQQAKGGPHKRGRRYFARRASSIIFTSA